ncbi:MAG: Uma2 family endonuclease [Acidobacteria bacterium]|nr:Uma2 family endonuclease [Acidobacteriota bacterium]
MTTAIKTLVTEDELLQMPKDGYRYELIEGELRRMAPAGGEHGVLAATFTIALGYFVDLHDLGVICAAETGFTLAKNPDTTRAPDLAFVSKARIPETGIPKGYWSLAPDLAVEVVSPNDTYDEVEDKIALWLKYGTSIVIVINPRRRNVKVYRSLTNINIFNTADTLTLPDMFSGFSYPVAKLFR